MLIVIYITTYYNPVDEMTNNDSKQYVCAACRTLKKIKQRLILLKWKYNVEPPIIIISLVFMVLITIVTGV